jgi:hypothetical protein
MNLQALFPFDDWWVVPAKVLFDQTAWSAVWNSIYYLVLGLLRLESPITTFSELKATFWPMLTVCTELNLNFFVNYNGLLQFSLAFNERVLAINLLLIMNFTFF